MPVDNILVNLKRVFIECLKITLVFTIVFSLVQADFSFESLKMNFLISAIYSYGIGFGNRVVNDFLDRKWNWLEQTNLRVTFGIIFTLLYTIPAVLGIDYLTFVVFQELDIKNFFSERMIWVHLFYVILSLGVSTFMHARSFMLNWKLASKKEIKEQKIIAGTASAKFESLKNQIDPHFLFNSLNVLSSLIEENPENAQKFTTSLSKIYRYVLEQKDKELVSVREELAFAKTYMNLLKMRFESNITFDLPLDFDNDEAKVVPLSLQLLLENTIKHNVVSANKPLHIKIFVKNRYLVVENNSQKKAVLQDRQGVGLQNIVNRYGLISERKVIVEENESHFKVFIPILTKQIAFTETKNILNENRAYKIAKERVLKLKAFYGNLTAYCCVIPLLVFINLVSNSNFQWFWFPMLGWGLGLTFHAIEAFGWSSSWEEKKIQEIINKPQSNTKWN